MYRATVRLAAALALAVTALTPPAPAEAQGGGADRGAVTPKPRVLVIAFAQNEPDFVDMVYGLAEGALLDLGLPLVDRSQVMARFQIEDLERSLVLDPESALLAELRTRYGADIVLTVRYFRQFMHEQELVGGVQRFYKTDVRVRAVSADAASVLYSGGGKTQIQARTDGFERLVTQKVTEAGRAILARWRGGEEGLPRPVQVIARGFDEDSLLELEGALEQTPGVLQVVRRDFGGPAMGAGNALVEVQLEVPTEDLARSLRGLTSPAVRVTASSAERIELVLAPAPEVGFVEPKNGAYVGGAGVPDLQVVVRASPGIEALTVNGLAATRAGDGLRTWRARIEFVEPGPIELVAAGRDEFGRTAEARITVTLDDEPPAVRFLRPHEDLVNARTVVVKALCSDGGAGVASVHVNGKAMTPADEATWTAEVELSEGPNGIEVVATDRLGNEARVSRELTLDSTPPSLDATVVAIIEGRVNENGVRIVCEGKDWAVAEDGSFRIAVESPVGGLVTVVAIDPAGNRTEKVYRIGREGTAEPQ